jgi:hypothetical protein
LKAATPADGPARFEGGEILPTNFLTTRSPRALHADLAPEIESRDPAIFAVQLVLSPFRESEPVNRVSASAWLDRMTLNRPDLRTVIFALPLTEQRAVAATFRELLTRLDIPDDLAAAVPVHDICPECIKERLALRS